MLKFMLLNLSFISVHRYCNSLQQQVCPQHWSDVVVPGEGSAQAEGLHLQGHALGGDARPVLLPRPGGGWQGGEGEAGGRRGCQVLQIRLRIFLTYYVYSDEPSNIGIAVWSTIEAKNINWLLKSVLLRIRIRSGSKIFLESDPDPGDPII